MTVAALPSTRSYLENGTTLTFAAPFRFLPGTLAVDRIAGGVVTPLVAGIDFTTAGGGTDAGGAVTLAATVAGATLRIRRDTPRTQAMDYTPGDRFPAESHEAALDRAMLVAQEQDALNTNTRDRALLVPDGETGSVLPPVATRANRFLAFTAAGALAAIAITPGLAGAAPVTCTSRIVLSNVAVTEDAQLAYLSETRRPGMFVWTAGDMTALVAADPLQALAVRHATIPPAAGAWVRAWDGLTAYAEWAGARADAPSVDNKPAIEAVLRLAAKVQLLSGDYFLSDALIVNIPNRRLIGAGFHYDGYTGRASRLVVKSATAGVIRVGLDAAPGGTNGLALNIRIEDIEFSRDRAPSTDARPVGVLVQNTQDAAILRCKSQDSITQFRWTGNVNLLFQDCRATRGTAGVGTAPDDYVGYHAFTSDPPLTSINGNASTRLERCVAVTMPIAGSKGLLLDGKWTDHSIDRFETAVCAFGIYVIGDGATANGGTDPGARTNANLEITRPWIDQFGSEGIYLYDVNKYGIVRIEGGYFGPSPGARSCIYDEASQGTLAIAGAIEMAMAAAPGARGILSIGTRKLSIGRGVTVVECGYRAFDFANIYNLHHEGTSSNEAAVLQQHTLMSGTSAANYLKPAMSGGSAKVAAGVLFLGDTHTRTTVDVSELDWACLAGADDTARKANRLSFNGAAVTAAGTFGSSNLATGNFA